MSDIEEGSLQYFLSRICDGQWAGFLRALADELNEQMPPEELRAFFYVVGSRMARERPLPPGSTLGELERNVNDYFGSIGWGWARVRDLHSSLEFLHACAPLRQAFGDASVPWAGAVLEGIYATWLKQLGAAGQLELHQIGSVEGPADSLRFRLAHPSYFA